MNRYMLRYEFETYVGENDVLVKIEADIDPGEPARLTGHPDDMHPGEEPDWIYEILLDGKEVSKEWAAQNVTDADRDYIENTIFDHVAKIKRGES